MRMGPFRVNVVVRVSPPPPSRSYTPTGIGIQTGYAPGITRSPARDIIPAKARETAHDEPQAIQRRFNTSKLWKYTRHYKTRLKPV